MRQFGAWEALPCHSAMAAFLQGCTDLINDAGAPS
jgi:hypothetical protein